MDIVIALLQYYSFDLGDYLVEDLVKLWSEYDPIWIRLAIIEALFRGRYKAISVDQILGFWQRRGEPYCRFSREFERLVCGDLVFPLPSLPRKVTYTSYRPPAPSQTQISNKTYSQTNGALQQPEKSTVPQSLTQKPQSATYQSAMQQMNLLADASLFVDKLKSMCKEIAPVPTETSWSGEINSIAQLPSYKDI
jgi:hypothetical protein